MNETVTVLRLRDFMESPDGWGRSQGREVYQKLIKYVESKPGVVMFRVSLEDVRRTDISFASETIIELAKRYRGTKGFSLVDLNDADMQENWEAAAERKQQPLTIWSAGRPNVIGPEASSGTLPALTFVLGRGTAKASDFVAATPRMTIANASTKFKQLAEQGYVLRREETAESGGIEFVYHRIG